MSKQSWVTIYGSALIADGTITHQPLQALTAAVLGEAPPGETQPAVVPHSVIRSDIEFEQGAISWESKLGDVHARAWLMLAADGSNAPDGGRNELPVEVAVGLNILGAPYGFAVWVGKWEALGGVGQGSSVDPDEWVAQKLVVRGSTLDFYVRGVRVYSATRTLKRGPMGVLLQSNSETSVRNIVVTQDAPMCFVVMQFTPEFNVLYSDVIRPLCEEFGYRVIRGDDFDTSGQILQDIVESLKTAALVIADVTPDNANVYYELGYAHALGKPTILLSDKKRPKLPFDIAGFRTILYDDSIGGKSVVEERLRKHLEASRTG